MKTHFPILNSIPAHSADFSAVFFYLFPSPGVLGKVPMNVVTPSSVDAPQRKLLLINDKYRNSTKYTPFLKIMQLIYLSGCGSKKIIS